MIASELIQTRDNFIEEIKGAIEGRKTSLPFIKHTISTTPLVKDDESFQVLMVGGSVFQSILLKRTNGQNEIVERSQGALPLFSTKDFFLQFVKEQLRPEIKVLAINFAYALTPVFENNILDGELVWGSKEHTYNGLIGLKVGQTVSAFIKQEQQRDLTVSIANDTICLLLAGLRDKQWNETACGIVGTGVNFAMFLDQKTAINFESGEFDKFTTTDSVKELDSTSAIPGSALLEKETSGAYLFLKYNIEIKKANIETPELTSTEQLDQVVQNETHVGYAIAKEIMDTSAQFTAIQISSIMEFHQRSMTFSMTGSLFWKGSGYLDNVKRFVKELSPTYSAEFIHIEDAEVFGAAKLVS